MRIRVRAILAVLAILAVSVSVSPTAQAHAITCSWVNMGVPYQIDYNTVGGNIRVSCSDNLDDANTKAQLQISINGQMQDRGVGVISYSTALNINVTDKTSIKSGCYYYRVQGTHFGQHGNIFALPTYYSNHNYICG